MWSLKINPIFHVITGNQIGIDNNIINNIKIPLSINLANLTNKFIAFLMAIYGILIFTNIDVLILNCCQILYSVPYFR